MTSANHQHYLCLLIPFLIPVFRSVLSSNVFIKSAIYPFDCSNHIQKCNSYAYHISRGYSIEKIASFYSVNTSDITPISHDLKQDYLVSIPCSCKDVNGTHGYFYDIIYEVLSGDTFSNVSDVFYSGQAWDVAGVGEYFVTGDRITIHLACGCVEVESQEVVTYTVQQGDTLSEIAELLSAEISGIEKLNVRLTEDPSFIDVGWVLFVPRQKKGLQDRSKLTFLSFINLGKGNKLKIIVSLLSAAALLSVCSLILFLLRRKKNLESREGDPKAGSKILRARKTSLLHCPHEQDIEVAIESERPVIYSVKEIDDATCNFDDNMKIGEGGYGSVYVGTLKEQEVAIKKMKSSRSMEFLTELKVLCKINHINVVELLGYASSNNHFYLIYEYAQNGSLNDHLHDPQLKGRSPLSWIERVQIALDAARGIEYIHNHTKARYVHRDIKTSNILLDQGLRAKVADFGLARLVERSNEEEFVATRLVGTPGYIAPESVRELQMTSKTDVFAFGVVLAELVTGQHALTRDNKEPNKLKSLISVINTIFRRQDSEAALNAEIDPNLRGNYPIEQVYKLAELSKNCLSEEAAERPEMREIVQTLSQILMSSIEWQSPLRETSQVFTG